MDNMSLNSHTIERLDKRWDLLTTVGLVTPGVSKERNPLCNPPDWYDPDRYARAQQLAKKYFLRYEDDPFDRDSKSHKSLMQVRHTCHMAVTRLMQEKYPQEDRLWLNQFDMAMTQWSLIGLVGIRPKQCGFHNTTREEFEEYMYFWKVIGYCMGIEDRFNICQDSYEESVHYFDICFRNCYKKHLDEQCPIVQMGMQLTEGVFLGLNGVIPKFVFSFEGFMKYWYEALGVKHPIELKNWEDSISYYMTVFTMDYMLRVPILYSIISYLFFKLQYSLFGRVSVVKDFVDTHYKDVKYELKFDDEAYTVDNTDYRSNV